MERAKAILADLRSRGVELETDGERLRWRPAFMVTGPTVELIQVHKAELLALLASGWNGERCPACNRYLDSAQRCPKCFDRLCVCCGRMTGLYFVATCIRCGQGEVDRDISPGAALSPYFPPSQPSQPSHFGTSSPAPARSPLLRSEP